MRRGGDNGCGPDGDGDAPRFCVGANVGSGVGREGGLRGRGGGRGRARGEQQEREREGAGRARSASQRARSASHFANESESAIAQAPSRSSLIEKHAKELR